MYIQWCVSALSVVWQMGAIYPYFFLLLHFLSLKNSWSADEIYWLIFCRINTPMMPLTWLICEKSLIWRILGAKLTLWDIDHFAQGQIHPLQGFFKELAKCIWLMIVDLLQLLNIYWWIDLQLFVRSDLWLIKVRLCLS